MRILIIISFLNDQLKDRLNCHLFVNLTMLVVLHVSDTQKRTSSHESFVQETDCTVFY